MSDDFVIRRGTNMRLTPVRDAEPALVSLLNATLEGHGCLKAYSLFSMRRGWLFPKQSRFVCLVHNDASAYRAAYADIGESLQAYFQTHSGILDLMSLDLGIDEERAFAAELMAKLPFRKKEPNYTPDRMPGTSAPGESRGH